MKDIKKKQDKGFKRGRWLIFAALAGAVSGYLLFKAGTSSPSSPEEAVSGETADSQVSSEPQGESPRELLSVGEPLPTVSLVSLSGERLKLRASEGSRPVLFYIFSPQCSICHETLPDWKELAQEAAAHSVEVVGISVLDPGSTAQYVRQFEIPWDVYCVGDRQSFQALGVQRVPVTLFMDGSGKIGVAKGGRLGAEDKETISNLLRETTG